MMATEVCRDKTLDSRHSNETTSAPLRHHRTEWRAFQKRKLCCRTLYILYRDYKQTLDSIDMGRLYKAVKSLKIPRKLINLLKMTLNEKLNKIALEGFI